MDVIDTPELVAITCWFLWWQRTLISRGEEFLTPQHSGPAIQALALNFVRAACTPPAVPRMNRWRKPLMGQFALNVDASFSDLDHSGACGAIVRDSNGAFIGASIAKLEHVADVVPAEVVALAEGYKLACYIGCNSILVQMDNLVIVESLNYNTGHAMIASPLLDECRALSLDFGKVLIEHCNRESNMVAHVLAQKGCDDPPNVWLDSPPGFIRNFLADDVSVI
ncbi:hypothetical protein VPH35_003405 [Triticum aestivum]